MAVMDGSHWIGLVLLAYTALRDAMTLRVPTWLLYAGIAGSALQKEIQGGLTLEWVLGALGGYLFVRLLIWLTRGAMGLGDAPAVALVCACEGWREAVVAFGLACCLASLVALAMILLRRIRRSDAIPFVPFLFAGGVLSCLWGPFVLSRLFLP